MKDELKIAIEAEDERGLIKCLDFGRSHAFDSNCYQYIEKALMGTWHSQHEDLINIIHLEKLIDDRFVDPILNIALDREKFRMYDDELESTLRKCVHALKTINSTKSNLAMDKLKDLNNDNVISVFKMYK